MSARRGANPRAAGTDAAPFRALMQQAWGIVGIGDAEGVVQWLSPSVEEILGYRPDELVGTNGCELAHPDDRDRLRDVYAGLADPGSSCPPVTVRCGHRDGTWRHL